MTYTGDLVIRDDLSPLVGVHVVDGFLEVYGAGDGQAIALPDLREVRGALRVQPESGDPAVFQVDVSLPCLEVVENALVVDGDRWPNPAFPALRSAARLDVEDVDAFSAPLLSAVDSLWVQEVQLSTFSPFLEISVSETIVVRDSPALPLCEVEAYVRQSITDGYRGSSSLTGLATDAALCEQPGPCPPLSFATAPDCTDAPAIVVSSTDEPGVHDGIRCASSVTTTDVSAVCLPGLQHVTGDVTLGASTTIVRLPILTTVDGDLGRETASLPMQEMNLDRLRVVGGNASFPKLQAMEEVVFLQLSEVLGSLRVADTSASLVYLPDLDDVEGDLILAGHTSAPALHLPALDDVGGKLRLLSNAGLTDVYHLDNNTNYGGVLIQFNPALESLSLLNLGFVTGALEIRDNPALWDLASFDTAFTHTGALLISGNGCLTDEEANAWSAEVTTPTSVTVLDNTGGSGCVLRPLVADFEGMAAPSWIELSPGPGGTASVSGGQLQLGIEGGATDAFASADSFMGFDASDGVTLLIDIGARDAGWATAEGGWWAKLRFTGDDGFGYQEVVGGYQSAHFVDGGTVYSPWASVPPAVPPAFVRLRYDGFTSCVDVSNDGTAWTGVGCESAASLNPSSVELEMGVWTSTAAPAWTITFDSLQLSAD